MTPIFSNSFLRYFLSYFLPSVLLVLALTFLGMQQAQKQQELLLKAEAHEKVLTAKASAVQNLDLIVRDVLYISQSKLLHDVVNVSDPQKSEQAVDALAQDWQALMSSSPMYDQIRWLDESGQERLRIDQTNTLPKRVAQSELQNKRDRYYFSQSVTLQAEQFYFSPFDLNIEFGEIEVPRKPMIRLSKPVFDAHGVNKGVVVLNYLGNDMLHEIKRLKDSEMQKIWLTNQEGYWLLGCVPQDEWGFMYDRSDLTVKSRFPEAWEIISGQEHGYFTDQDGIWHFDTIRPMQETVRSRLIDISQIIVDEVEASRKMTIDSQQVDPYFWKVVYFTPMQQVVSVMREERLPYYIGLFVVLFILFLGSTFLAHARLAKEAALKALQVSNQQLDNTSKQLALDLIAKEQAQLALEESVERYSGVLNASMDGFVLMNRYGVILEYNQALYGILHIENRVIEGIFLGALFEGEQRQQVANRVGDLFVQGYCRFEVESVHNEKTFYIEISLMPIAVTEQICAFVRDITVQKENDFQLEMAASVFTHANEGIILTDDKFLIVDVNDEFEFITGYQRAESIANQPSFLESSKHSESFYDDMKHYLTTKGHWYGELWSRRKTGELFLVFLNVTRVQHPHDKTGHYVWMFNDITLEKQYQKRLQNSANYDQLTNLPNRFLLNDRIQQAMMEAKRYNHFIAIVFIDLDGFKAVNDTFGHDMGDNLLINVAKQMKAALRAIDTVARIGGDEFVAVIGGLNNQEDATPIFEKLLKAATTPIQKEEKTVQVSGSLGVTFFPQAEKFDVEQLIRQADQAMYKAKQDGKNRFHIFDIQQDSEQCDLTLNLNCIEQAISNNELVLHYQPKVSLFNDDVIGLEALVRWQHPEKGLLYPSDFLSSIENTQLSVKLTEWVVKHTMQQIETWQKQGLKLAVSINVGAFELQKPDFIEWMGALLDEFPSIERSQIELELLETSALEDLRSVQELIQNCKNRGIIFALDGFGTGFASLSYLKRLQIETIKIDQSFIHNMFEDSDDITLLEGLIGLTKSLDRRVIAEGIETEEQGKMLINLGCHFGQGYFIAKPMAAHDVPKWIAKWRRPDSWVNQVSFIDEPTT